MREVLSNHTYRHRAFSVLAPLNGVVTLDNYSILVLGVAKTVEEAEHLIAMFNAQTYKNKHMVLLVPNHMKRIIPSQPSIQIEDQARFKTPNKTMTNSDYITLFDAEAFYGTHYLTDFMNTTTYSDYDVVVKGCNLQVVNNELMYNTVLLEYKEATGLVTLKNSMVKTRFFMTLNHASLTTPFNSSYFVIDSFNYFENNYELSDELKSKLAI